jgi:hypothetical protein
MVKKRKSKRGEDINDNNRLEHRRQQRNVHPGRRAGVDYLERLPIKRRQELDLRQQKLQLTPVRARRGALSRVCGRSAPLRVEHAHEGGWIARCRGASAG